MVKERKKVVVFIQARMGSSRLPGKVMMKINDRPIISYQIERIKRAKEVDEVVVITTNKQQDKQIVNFCIENNINYFAGSESDLLDRHYQAAKKFEADFVIKIPSDSPFSDPEIIDNLVATWRKNESLIDYISNYHPPTFPDGLDVEGASFDVVKDAWKNADKDFEREHTFPYIWDSPDKYRIWNVENPNGDFFLSHRWTLDYLEDFKFIKKVFEILYPLNKNFSMEDLCMFLDNNPDIKSINSHLNGVNWYRNELDNLKTIGRSDFMNMSKKLKTSNSVKHLKKTLKVIPGASQTLSKGYTQWSVGASPLFIEEANGCQVKDLDGNWYIDFGMGLGPFILGYSDPDITKAVNTQLSKGTMFTLPSSLEYDAAKLICDVVPCAEMVRFGKNGSDVTSAAVKLARAYTKRDKILSCGYHGWQDWYISSTERDSGIPKSYKSLIDSVGYNDIESLESLIRSKKYSCIIMEPVGAVKPEKNFLHKVRELCDETNTVLIFDELFTGFRWSIGGASEYFNVIPDLACFGKALSNGMPVSCIAGKKKIMSLFEHVFFSFTYGGEALSLAAIIANIKKLKANKVYEHIETLGNYLIEKLSDLINKNNLKEVVSINGYPFKSVLQFASYNGFSGLEIKTFIQQEMAKRGVLFIGYHLLSFSHTKKDIEFTLMAYDEVFNKLSKVLNDKNLLDCLEGEVVTQIFKNVGDRSQK